MDQDNLGPTLLIICWVFAALAITVVSVRYYVRMKVTRKTTIDDWIILLTLCLALANNIFCSISVHHGLGRHIQSLSEEQIMYTIKYVYLCEFFSIMSPGFGRISFAFLLLGLIPPQKWRRRFLWTIISIQFVVDVGTVIISFSQCRPITGFWDPSVAANCWPPKVQQYTGYFQGSVCSMVDLLLALFPASLFWNLNMKLSTKVSLSTLMGLGLFAMIASIIKTIELRAITEKGDATHAMAVLAIWWTLEAHLVLIAASIPTLKPLLKIKGTSRVGNSSSGGNMRLKAWPAMYPTRATDGTLVSDGPFFPLKGGSSPHTTRSDQNMSSAYEADAYHPSRGFVESGESVADDGIKKETTMTVTYAKGSVMVETGPLAPS